jgi:hypothetical protein
MTSFKRRKYQTITIPDDIFASKQNVLPGLIVIRYEKTINLEKIDKTVRHKHKVLVDRGKDVKSYDIYFEKSESLISNYEKDSKAEYLQEYLDLCKNYLKIECIKIAENIIRCKGCNAEMGDDEEDEENIFVCKACECINNFLKPNSYIKSKETISQTEDTMNFIKVLDKFEGRSEPHPPESIYEDLDKYFISINKPPGLEYRKQKLNSLGKKDGTSKQILWDALENTENSKFYDESNFIAHKYWGWELPDISKLRDKLLLHYQETQNVWREIKHKYKRSASLGTQFRLYVQLCGVGCKYRREDFKIQDMIESLIEHNEAWKEMCDKAKIPHVYVS